jgi:competence protein ComEC
VFTLLARELRQIPFIRLIVPFIAGILIELKLEYLPDTLSAGIFLLFLILLLPLIGTKISYGKRFWVGVLVYSALFLSGGLLAKTRISPIPDFPKEAVIVKAVITEPLSEKPNSFQTVLQTHFFAYDSLLIPVETKLIAYLEKDSTRSFFYGDEIIFQSRISEVQNPGNPDEFDYKSYLLNRAVTGQCYIETEKLERTAQKKGNPIIALGLNTRNLLSQIYRDYGIEGDEFAVLKALTLGDKSELNPETREAYAKAGAMHILAVSGLHVGIIYFILNYIFGFLDKIKIKRYMPGRILKAIVLFIGLWFFALLTGFSPSVQRAAVMFSFVVAGNMLNRRINIYNSLSASAFFLLIYNPLLITAVGFQLSYIAVISIVYLQPRLQKLITFKQGILHKIWVLTTVSVAAQIGTTPISFLYFHLFPNWFFLSNLIVIPLATLIVYNAGLLLAVSALPYISDMFALSLKYTVKLLNGSVTFIEQLPASATENIPFELADTIFWYLIIISLLIFFQYKQIRQLQISIAILIVYLGFLGVEDLQHNNQQRLMVYNIRNASIIQFIKGNSAVSICDTSLHRSVNYEFAVKTHELNSSIHDNTFLELEQVRYHDFLYRKDEFLFFGEKTIVFLNNKEQSRFSSAKSFDADCVILSGNEYFFMDDIQNLYNPEMVVFDSSNKLNRIERWKEECDTLGIKYHSVPEEGVFVLNAKEY